MKSKVENTIVKFWLTVLLGAGMYFLLSFLAPMNKLKDTATAPHIAVDLILFTIVAGLIWKSNALINNKITGVYERESNPAKRLIFQILASTVFTFGLVLLLVAGYSLFMAKSAGGIGIGQYFPMVRDDIILFVALFLFYQAVYIGLYFFHQWEGAIRQSEKLKQDLLHSQLHALQNQANPHFLFNSMNVLSSLIEEDPETAVVFVKKLSDVYRYVLQRTDEHVIELRDEVEFIRSYAFLLNQRFGNNLVIEINLSKPALEMYVVPFSLQILFENAVKHNIISAEKNLVIRLYTEGEGLIIANNYQPKISAMPSTGKGLVNIESRYKILAGKSIEVIKTEKEFKVVLPLIKNRNVFADDNN